MPSSDTLSRRDRVLGAAGAVALSGLLLWGIWRGLELDLSPAASDAMTLFSFAPDPPPPEAESVPPPPPPTVEQPAPRPLRHAGEEGAASAANLRSRASPVVAPPIERPLLTMPFSAAPVPATGTDGTSGASDRPGPGTGAGGEGAGFGSGRSGDGTGGGGGGGGRATRSQEVAPPATGANGVPTTRARWLSGTIEDSDYPRSAREAGMSGTTVAVFIVTAKGRASQCRTGRSSGDGELDRTTCELITRRFRFRPARDDKGRTVSDVGRWEHRWEFTEVVKTIR